MIHKYRQNGLNIVLDVNSGSVHVVSDAVYDMLDYYETKPKDEILPILNGKYDTGVLNEAYEEITWLLKEGILFSDDIYKNLGFGSRETVVKALCLLVSQDCNLKCGYCFAGEGGYNSPHMLMDAETGKKAIDFLFENSGSRRNLEVDFFGGEPLMNFEVIKEIVRYARSIEKEKGKNTRFTITTNGILLDNEKIEYINKEMHNIVLSMDGRKHVNDKMRKNINGQSVYSAVVPPFLKVAALRNQKNYYVRGTFTRNNLDFSKDVLHLAGLGFKQVSVEPVVGGKELPYTLKAGDLPKIFSEYELLAEQIVTLEQQGEGFAFFHFIIDLEGGPCVSKRLSGCGAGSEYLAVTASGGLYPCHQFTGIPKFRMGSIYEGVTNIELRDSFKSCNVYKKSKCSQCFAKFYCSGGCAANAYNENNDISIPYELGCEMQKKRTECAIYIKAALA